jgi:PQQ-dependent catabolism-associated CXXCW motif protein
MALMIAGAAPPEPDGFRIDDYRAPVPATLKGGEVVHTEQMRDIVGRRDAVLIDVLPAPRRPEGMRPGTPWLPQPHQTLPGARWWPDVGRGALSAELEAAFHLRLQQVAGAPPRLVVFFCLSDCWMSWNAAKRAVGWGYVVAWFPDGVDGWEAAGLPTEAVQPVPLD